MWRTSGRWRWGFCSIRSWLAAYLRRVAALMMRFPPIGGGVAEVCGGVAAKVQTHWAKIAENGVLWARWSAFWAQRCSGVVCWSHASLLLRAVTRSVAHRPAIVSVGGAAHARISGLTCGITGPRASRRARVRMCAPMRGYVGP